MSMNTDLIIKISADNKADAELAGLEGRMSKLSGIASKLGGVFTGVIGGAVVGALSDAARAAADDEASVLQLQQAVENSGSSWEANASAIDARIKAGQALAFSDSDTRASLAQLTTATGDVNKALSMQGVVMDIARGRNIDLGAATDIAQKAALGNYGALKKLGIEIDATMTPTQALGELQKRYAGQAEVYGNSTRGSIDKIKDGIGEWQESLGAVLGPAQGVIAMLPGLSSGMSLAGGAIGGLSSIIKLTAIPSLVAMAIPFAPVLIAIAAIGAAVFLLKMAWENDWGGIREKAAAALDFLSGVFDGFKAFVAGWGLALIGIVRGAINIVVGILNTLIDGWNAVAGRLNLPILGKIQVQVPGLDAAEAALNNLARPRVANVFTNVYQQAIAGGGGTRMFAEGGIVTSPTRAIIGEAGPEAVIPLSQSGGFGTTNYITIHVTGNITESEHKLADMVGDRIIRDLQFNRLNSY